MRMTQYIGLTQAAQEWIEKEVKAGNLIPVKNGNKTFGDV